MNSDEFDCGRDALNRFLARYAFQNQQASASGYYTLVVGQVEYDSAPRRPVLIMVLARLAVARSWQGQGLGAGLLKDAMQRTLQAADIAGIRAFAVHAKDDGDRAFYEHFGFSPLPSDPYNLFRLLKDIKS
jgi:predicted N-acetyltransferase YhbS